MAKKKVEKNAKTLTMAQIAEEMNDVMQYGYNPDTGEWQEEEMLDTELDDEHLQKHILERAKEDLRPEDQESFTSEVWDWFIANGITPGGEVVDAYFVDAGEVVEVEDDGGEAGVEDVENVTAKNPAKKNAKEKPLKKQTAVAKREPKERGLSNEEIAIEMIKEGKTQKDLLVKFTEVYSARGKDNEDYIVKRTNIYYNIACKALGINAKPAKEKPSKEKVVKAEMENSAPEQEEKKGKLKKK